ncbi:MAG: 23S rRNA (uracil(1939)-C(5))-methyltransferase RlmD [Bacteroidales bacterium]|nr:23S rRNA (uracil(1939)-C(5))-methyltransferase RlmD [Bacteroidales bacterium]
MIRSKKKFPIYEKVEIIDTGSEGKAVAKYENKVIFIPFAVPGDIIDIKITKRKKSFYEGKAIHFHKYSEKRMEPVCEHFGLCGGCKWQNMKYEDQLYYKQKQVKENFKRIGKFDIPDILPIIPSKNIFHYRNKLEFSFSNKKWLTEFSKEIDFKDINMNGLGFHIPGMFDRILNINNCYLQKEPSNSIRLTVKKYADENNLDYYNVRKWPGFLRNLVIRTTNNGDLMLIFIFNYNDKKEIEKLLDFIYNRFPEINSLMYLINDKKNDTYSDLEPRLYNGNPYIIEKMPAFSSATGVSSTEKNNLQFKIGPLSFFQTNSSQAYELYKIVYEFAGLKGNEIVYDLYTGIGTIANLIASSVGKVIGIEYIASAIKDAKENSIINNIHNTHFFAGDIVNVLNEEFISKNGKPDCIITDPPRAGMHEKVIKQILEIKPEKIVYISCNPATQARDIALMDTYYKVDKIQPVDMFPHTHHVENVVLLKLM